jgi:hypothetical protein
MQRAGQRDLEAEDETWHPMVLEPKAECSLGSLLGKLTLN